ncbi:hypothetical protein M430DRAFT_53546 [Amorphotheca resinae ATCC 22711]|uniref:Uncharacterized protein n=1 Tax=Amorphotheca resinae ATCC 22711 TaxID=857342 RepID=A0A2T3ARG9_AMORE|nr:hypothetical protein M430DRAFT_53546 [Amorphotheca resinae ATCC 22711]PSS08969.1 hypothetical protein M430DRAFT_53546 [Amorphotheca resinae ATCC 22711]
MGTRGLLGLIIQAQRHAAYNHFDSYPTGLGQEIVNFINGLKPEDYATMEENLRQITWLPTNADPPSPELQEKYSKLGYSNPAVGERTLGDWYCLLHKTQGAGALPEILKGNLKHQTENIQFLDDCLFCEWAYFIDFGNRTLEVWRAGQKIDEITFGKLAQQDVAYMQRLEDMEESEEEINQSNGA